MIQCISCNLPKDDCVLVTTRPHPKAEWGKHRMLCGDCRKLKSTRGHWKYLEGAKAKIKRKWKCKECGHDTRKYLFIKNSDPYNKGICIKSVPLNNRHPQALCHCRCWTDLGTATHDDSDLLKEVIKTRKSRMRRKPLNARTSDYSIGY